MASTSITPEEFFKAYPKIPKWFSSNKIFKEVNKIGKIFPHLGLPNFSETLNPKIQAKILDSQEDYKEDIIFDFLSDIQTQHIRPILVHLQGLSLKAKTKIRISNIENLIYILNQIDTIDIGHIYQIGKDGKINLNFPYAIYNQQQKAVFNKGERYLAALNKIPDLFDEVKIAFPKVKNIETFSSFKEFSAINQRATELKVCFSSTGKDGLWDILTMSMRGIQTCQSWNGDYHNSLIGSVLDPSTAIIYLTNGNQTTYGNRTLYRSIVRYVNYDNKPSLLIDHCYSIGNDYDCESNLDVQKLFQKILKEKTNLPIILSDIGRDYDERKKITPFKSQILKKLFDKSEIDDPSDYSNDYQNLLPYYDTPIDLTPLDGQENAGRLKYNKNFASFIDSTENFLRKEEKRLTKDFIKQEKIKLNKFDEEHFLENVIENIICILNDISDINNGLQDAYDYRDIISSLTKQDIEELRSFNTKQNQKEKYLWFLHWLINHKSEILDVCELSYEHFATKRKRTIASKHLFSLIFNSFLKKTQSYKTKTVSLPG